MLFSTSVVLGTLSLASSAIASPLTKRESTFYLQTSLRNGSTDTTKENLYLEAYHTGAGFNDATLNSFDTAAKAFLNGTNLQFDLGQGDEYPWGLVLYADTNYAAWDPVEVNVGYGTGSFAIVDNKLVWSDEEFLGWIACDWNHALPQLFWMIKYYGWQIPSSCSYVDLNVTSVY